MENLKRCGSVLQKNLFSAVWEPNGFSRRALDVQIGVWLPGDMTMKSKMPADNWSARVSTHQCPDALGLSTVARQTGEPDRGGCLFPAHRCTAHFIHAINPSPLSTLVILREKVTCVLYG